MIDKCLTILLDIYDKFTGKVVNEIKILNIQ